MFAAMLWQFQNGNNFLPSATTAQFSSENYFNNSILNQQLISTKFKQQNENKFGKEVGETRTNRLRNDILIDCWEACGSTTELSNVEISPKTSSSTKSIKLYGKLLLFIIFLELLRGLALLKKNRQTFFVYF